jgi:tetratricopeptide (TPR) repeat protein
VGNIDRVYGMQWRVELTLRPGRAVLEQHTTLYNRSDVRHRFYWWTNAGVQVQDDSRILYPMRFTAAHGFADIDTWPTSAAGVDLSLVRNHTSGPVSRFAYGSREPFMAVYHPGTDSGVVHFSPPTDLPAKKIWSWGSNADGLDWRRALSDNNSAYVEIQAGLFRNQETYAFLEPQESIHFSEYWIPIRKIGGVSRANPEAVINISRPGSGRVKVALNVTTAFPNATVAVSRGGQVIAKETVSLSPATAFVREHPDVGPAGEACTVVVRDEAGRVVLEHTEDGYDYLPASEVPLGPQPAHRYLAAGSRSEGDWLAIGTEQELDGQLLVALETYRQGLRLSPDSLDLNRAVGRLAVGLKQFELAETCLSKVVDRVSTDRESAYYLALASTWLGRGATRARTLLESAQQYGTFRPAALLALAGLDARGGDREGALRTLQHLTAEQPNAVRAGGLEIALLRTLKHADQARIRLASWLQRDPTSSFLRYEATRLGREDPALWPHLAADPERILEIAVDYMRFGLFDDALALLSRQYPTSGKDVVSEPGMPRPGVYPLIAYYRAACRRALGQSAAADLAAAAAMPATYVFPNRADTLDVLKSAMAANASDGQAHFLLGSLYLSGGMVDPAMDAWETARRLRPQIPVLHRNMGATLLQTGGSLDRAIALLEEGTTVDRENVGLYVALEQAMSRAGRPAEARARAILSFPDQKALPTALVFRLATALAEAGRFDEAERQFEGRFFAREEGGVNVRQVYLEVRARRAAALAAGGRCADALDLVSHLTQPVAGLPFTRDGLEAFLARGVVAELVAKVTGGCEKK